MKRSTRKRKRRIEQGEQELTGSWRRAKGLRDTKALEEAFKKMFTEMRNRHFSEMRNRHFSPLEKDKK